jgi:ribosomal protein S18 acetylase RimI-like enzyme
MKDAKGHGSNPRGAHNAGIDKIARVANPPGVELLAAPLMSQSERAAFMQGLDKIGSNVDVNLDVNDAYRDSVYGSVGATMGQNRVGSLEFRADPGEVNVHAIRTDPAVQGRGIATKMMDRLKQEFPDDKINWGGLTPEGAAFKKAYEARKQR